MQNHTPHEHINSLERQLQISASETPVRNPWVPREREEIIRVAKECLGVRDEWIPCIEPTSALSFSHGSVSIYKLRATSWEGCYVAAHLYLPRTAPSDGLPLVILCCGHGQGCKQREGYRRMAWLLAEQNCAVLVPDNIGQGERVAMGHSNVVAPFRCGSSLQGLIVMETMGWLRWARGDGRFDRKRIAAIGNSGGGTLTLFLGAFCREELAALSSSGYPCTFDFIAAKEKKHCHCNILPGIVGSVHMWQLYGCFAPNPLFLFQGRLDHFFPEDLFHSVCRRTGLAYDVLGVGSVFQCEVFAGGHSWDDERRESLLGFLAETLRLDGPHGPSDFPTREPEHCYETWPDDALTTDELAAKLTGIPTRRDDELYKVYQPMLETGGDTPFSRGGFRQIAAQMRAFLKPL